jgi:chorismate synthase
MVEAMVALVLADHLMQHISQCELLSRSTAAGSDVQVINQFS